MKRYIWMLNLLLILALLMPTLPVRAMDNTIVTTATAANVYYVDAGATSGSKTGDSWTDAYTALQDALNVAEPGDEIWVAEGVYIPTLRTDPVTARTETFSMPAGVAIYGGFAATETLRTERDWLANITVLSGDLDDNDIIDANSVITSTAGIVGDNAYHVVSSESVNETAILDGVTITGGSADGEYPHDRSGGMHNYTSSPALTNVIFIGNSAQSGGGMYNYGSSPTLTDVTFTDNTSADYGGGMHNYNSNPTLTNVTFNGNSAQYGGGMSNDTTSTPLLNDVTFSANTAAVQGGGMYNIHTSNPTLSNTTFISNTATNSGGGMFNDYSNPILTDVTFTDNTALDGGGIFNMGGSPTLVNTTFINNTTITFGGGIYNYDSSPTLIGITFNDNEANYGGGMYNIGGSPTMTNTTFTSNTATTAGGGMYNLSSIPSLTNVTFNGNVAANDSGGGMVNSDSNPTLVNTTFSGNTSTEGGGMVNYNSNPTLVNTTFSGNTAIEGGGMANYNSNPTLVNSIFWDNTATAGSSNQISNTLTSTPVISYSLIQGSGGSSNWDNSLGTDNGNNLDADPLFVDPDGEDDTPGTLDDDLHPGYPSPAIDAGDNDAVPMGVATDLAGMPRFIDIPTITDTGNGTAPIVDMGAYEAFFPPTAVDDAYTTPEVTVLTGGNVLDNDTDIDGGTLTAVLDTPPLAGTLELDASGVFTYTPELDVTGAITFTYHAADGNSDSNIANVTLTVIAINYLPFILRQP